MRHSPRHLRPHAARPPRRRRLPLQLEAAAAELAQFRAEAGAAEAALRRDRRRAQNDLEAALSEYDVEVGAMERALLAAQASHGEVLEALQVGGAPRGGEGGGGSARPRRRGCASRGARGWWEGQLRMGACMLKRWPDGRK
jgi:hypothetical protein